VKERERETERERERERERLSTRVTRHRGVKNVTEYKYTYHEHERKSHDTTTIGDSW
jgi:hypothetical protein